MEGAGGGEGVSEYIKIPVTQEMRNDLADCEVEAEFGMEKSCSECSLNAGEFGCLDEYDWLLDDPEHPASSGGSVFVPAKAEEALAQKEWEDA